MDKGIISSPTNCNLRNHPFEVQIMYDDVKFDLISFPTIQSLEISIQNIMNQLPYPYYMALVNFKWYLEWKIKYKVIHLSNDLLLRKLMSQSKSQTKYSLRISFHKQTEAAEYINNERHNQLIFGYIRNNENNIKLSSIIPSQIIQLIYNFYPKKELVKLVDDCSVKYYLPNTDLSHWIISITANDLRYNMWILDDKTGLPGKVFDLKHTKTGKHGHRKYSYKLAMPHSGKTSSIWNTHPGKHLKKCIVKHEEYLMYSLENEELICLNNDYTKIYFKISKKRENVYKKIKETIKLGLNKKIDIYVVVLEGPMMYDNKQIDILQLVVDAKLANK